MANQESGERRRDVSSPEEDEAFMALEARLMAREAQILEERAAAAEHGDRDYKHVDDGKDGPYPEDPKNPWVSPGEEADRDGLQPSCD